MHSKLPRQARILSGQSVPGHIARSIINRAHAVLQGEDAGTLEWDVESIELMLYCPFFHVSDWAYGHIYAREWVVPSVNGVLD